MLLDNGNKEAVFDVSKLTAFAVNVFSTIDDTQGGTQGGTQGELDLWIEEQIRKNPNITTEELAKISKKGLRTIPKRESNEAVWED